MSGNILEIIHTKDPGEGHPYAVHFRRKKHCHEGWWSQPTLPKAIKLAERFAELYKLRLKKGVREE
tara:strand:- start:381 stop:578 length:198 start_codon:yes stop_codon:yes gene_type:complete